MKGERRSINQKSPIKIRSPVTSTKRYTTSIKTSLSPIQNYETKPVEDCLQIIKVLVIS